MAHSNPYKTMMDHLDNLVKSRFIEMFGHIEDNELHFPVEELGTHVEIRNGRDYKHIQNDNGKYPVYGSGGIMTYANEYLCPEETVIIGRKGTIDNPILVHEKFWNVDTAFGMICDQNILNPVYFYWFCKNYNFKQHNKATTLPSLTKQDIQKIKLIVPDKIKQDQFATFVEQVDKSKTIVQKCIDKYDQLVKSRFIEMFEGSKSSNWEHLKIIDTCTDPDDIKCGPFGTQLSKDDYQKEGIPVWGIPEINSNFKKQPSQYVSEEKAKQLKQYKVSPKDIVMSRKGNVGMCSVFPDHYEEGIIHSDAIRIRVNKEHFNPQFLRDQLHFSQEIKKQIIDISSGAIMPGINVSKMKQMIVYIPPIELQNQYAFFVQQIDKSKF